MWQDVDGMDEEALDWIDEESEEPEDQEEEEEEEEENDEEEDESTSTPEKTEKPKLVEDTPKGNIRLRLGKDRTPKKTKDDGDASSEEEGKSFDLLLFFLFPHKKY